MSRDDELRELTRRLLGPAGPELTCEECFDRLDEYVDRELAGDPPPWAGEMRAHLEGCPACHDDHERLRELVRRTG